MKGLCEICGSNRYEVFPAIFEGNRILACTKCIKSLSLTLIKSRSEVEAKRLSKPPKKSSPRHRPATRLRNDYMLAEGYGKRIKRAREAKDLSQEDLAKLINEKASLIKKVEGEKIIPPPTLIRKLEHHLKVKILEKVADEEPPPRKSPSLKRPSLGDIAVFRGGEGEE